MNNSKSGLNYILSPCGTSLLTNNAGETNRHLIFKYANCKGQTEIPEEDLKQLQNIISLTKERLFKARNKEAEKISAELNGILKIYKGDLSDRRDYHLLLCTDTFLGETTANFISEWLTKKNNALQIEVHRHTDLQTNDIDSFQLSLSELIKKLSKEIPKFKQSGYNVIFNLTGGFKSVQGFLQNIASFYADESVYVFETSDNLLWIPRLPVRLDAMHTVESNIQSFRKLSLGLPVEDTSDIPETLLFKLDDHITLSPWGELVWKETKRDLYQIKLYPPPSDKVVYSQNFEKSVAGLPKDRKEIINGRIDQLSKHLVDNNYNPRSLDFKQLKGNSLHPSTHELDAWSDKDAKRIFGYFESNKFILSNIDKGIH